MSYSLTIGGPVTAVYTLPRGFAAVRSVNRSSNVPAAKLPRADGARVPTGYLEAKHFKVEGAFIYGPLSNLPTGKTLRQALDDLNAALNGGPQNFTTDSDRYWPNCQKTDYEDTYGETGFNRHVAVSFGLICPGGYQLATTATTATTAITATSQTLSITPTGNAYSLPQISVTVGTSATLNATLTNAATGDSCTLKGAVTSGDVLIVDSLLQQVTRAGIDVTSFFDGSWIRLAPGVSNVITETYSASTITNLTLSYNARYY
jgi:hypothetical protein